MPFHAPPPTAAWTHEDARAGFEVVYLQADNDGQLLIRCTTALQDGRTWIIDYKIRVDASWTTRSALITGSSTLGLRTVLLEHDGQGRWQLDGDPAQHLDGYFDVDLESSAMTHALPAPAAYARAEDLRVERLEQEYLRPPARSLSSTTTTRPPPSTSGASSCTTSTASSSGTPALLPGLPDGRRQDHREPFR